MTVEAEPTDPNPHLVEAGDPITLLEQGGWLRRAVFYSILGMSLVAGVVAQAAPQAFAPVARAMPEWLIGEDQFADVNINKGFG